MVSESITYSEMIASQLTEFLSQNEGALILGVGVADPKGIFGTTLKPRLRFSERVLETPLSENALTGVCVGLSLEGYIPILVHARTDFLTLSAEHLINTAAKWNFSHHSESMGRVIVRAIQGRGWGQGPQHSQNLATMFLNVPGINVWMPVSEEGYKEALNDTSASAVVIIEPRRLYAEPVLSISNEEIISEAVIYTYGDAILDAMHVASILQSQDVDVEVCPIEQLNFTVNPPPTSEKTKLAVICENSPSEYGVSSELAFYLAKVGVTVERISPPFLPCPTSFPLEINWYPQPKDLLNVFVRHYGLDGSTLLDNFQSRKELAFTGPF